LSLKPWRLTLAETSHLKPHEQSIPEIIEKLAAQISEAGRIYHPVIVDASTGIVVDGTHRVEAALKLGLRHMPVYTVDYMSDRVVLESWGRLVRQEVSVDHVIKIASDIGFKKVPARLGMREFTLWFFWRDGSQLPMLLEEKDVKKIYQSIANLDNALRDRNLSYAPEGDIEVLLTTGQYSLGYRVRSPKKEEILDCVMNNFRLPPKTTRHIVSGRPMYILCPLNILNDENAKQLFDEWVRRGRWIDIPEGAVIDRRYDERLIIYYREDLRNFYHENLLRLLNTVKV